MYGSAYVRALAHLRSRSRATRANSRALRDTCVRVIDSGVEIDTQCTYVRTTPLPRRAPVYRHALGTRFTWRKLKTGLRASAEDDSAIYS